LSDTQREKLWSSYQADLSMDMVFQPDDEFVRGLSPESRAIIYSHLGRDDRNSEQVNVFRYRGPSVELWTAEVALPPAIKQELKSLCYRYGGYWMFADWRLLGPKIDGLELKTQLMRVLDSDQTYLIHLHVDEKSDLDTLTQYWGQRGRQNIVHPLIESVAKIPGGNWISIRGFLPPFAQTRICTHPLPTIDPVQKQRDCHWTALNFFSTVPNDSFAASNEAVVKEIKEHYYPVFGNFQLGDVVLFMTHDDQLFHSAVYIADDLLFTKNGRLPSTPWSFIRLDDMRNYYSQEKPPKVVYYRHKDGIAME